MSAISGSIDIQRSPREVFEYASTFSHYRDWQGGVLKVSPRDGSTGTGATAEVTRNVGPRKLTSTEQIVEFDADRCWAVRATGGPVHATARGRVEPLESGGSRVTIEIEFEAQGLAGHLIMPLARGSARGEVTRNVRRLKEILEADAAG